MALVVQKLKAIENCEIEHMETAVYLTALYRKPMQATWMVFCANFVNSLTWFSPADPLEIELEEATKRLFCQNSSF